MFIINIIIKMRVRDIITKVPCELIYIIMEFLSYEEVCYILHYAPTLSWYVRSFNLINRQPKYYTLPTEDIILYADTNLPLFHYIVSNLMLMPFPYTYNNHLLFCSERNIYNYQNLYDMTAFIIDLNNVDILKMYLDNMLMYILNTTYDYDDNGFTLLFNDIKIDMLNYIANSISINNNYELFDTFFDWLCTIENDSADDFFEYVFFEMTVNNYNSEFITRMMNERSDTVSFHNDTIMDIPLNLMEKDDHMAATILNHVFSELKEHDRMDIFNMEYIITYCINEIDNHKFEFFKVIYEYCSDEVKQNIELVNEAILSNNFEIFEYILQYFKIIQLRLTTLNFFKYIDNACKNTNIQFIKYLIDIVPLELKMDVSYKCLVLCIKHTNYEGVVYMCNNSQINHKHALSYCLTRIALSPFDATFNQNVQRCINYVNEFQSVP